MNKKVFVILFCIVLLFCGCATPLQNGVITDLGICSAENTYISKNARNPWDITIIDNDVYVATGDYDKNTGGTSIWKYDNSAAEWINSGNIEQEAIVRFLKLNDKDIAIGVDPVDRPEYADTYVLENGKWEIFSQIKDGIHIFDAEYFDNSFYFGLGYEGNEYPVVKYNPETNEYINIPLYKRGVDYVYSLDETLLNHKRVYDLFLMNGKLFCVFSCYYTEGKITIEFFELKNDRFEFCTAFKLTKMRMNKIVKNQMLFNSDAVVGKNCYISTGNLYKTKNFIKFNKIDIPDNACVTDLLVDKIDNKEILYILAVVKKDGQYENIIYRLDGNKVVKVYSFYHGLSALSFAKSDNVFYVGLGGDSSKSKDNGRVLKITFDEK